MINDGIEVQFKMDNDYLNKALDYHDIRNDPAFKHLEKQQEVMKLKQQSTLIERCTPAKEIVDSLAKEALKMGKPELEDGVMSFNFFINATKCIANYLVPQLAKIESDCNVKRRQFLRDNKQYDYANMHYELDQMIYMARQRFSNLFFAAIDVDFDTF